MDIQTKYESLDPRAKKQVEEILELLLKRQNNNFFDMTSWKERIKSIPKWSEEDLTAFEENKKMFNQWPSYKW